MKNVLIGLLVVAAGAGIFLLLRKKKNAEDTNEIKKEWIVGKWKPQLYEPAIDTTKPKYQYDFQKEGLALRAVSDSAKADSLKYEWNKTSQLVIKENAADTVGKVFTVAKLTQDSLQLVAADKATVLFTKAK
jgi:hypothetical protein